MGSKGPSGATTTTVQQTNPIAQAQLGPLSNLYGSAEWQRQNQPYDPVYLNNLYAQNQGQVTSPLAAGVMPAAIRQYQNLIGMGIPAAGQAGQLTANAADAIQQGLNYGGALSGVANTAIGQSPYWQNQFAANAYNARDVLGNYGNLATGALSDVGNYAMNTLPGMGQAATGAITALAPGAINQLTGLGQNAATNLPGLAPGALSGLTNLSGQAGVAGNPAEAGLYGNAAMALANPALSSGLRGLASGAYINPSTNPAYAGMIQAATQPLVNQYQTATAPQITSQFEGAGRYGSGAQTNAVGQAQYGLGQGLANAISGITANAYNTGLNATLGAGQALGGIYNTGIGNITSALGTGGQLAQAGTMNAGNLLNQGYGTAGNLLNQGYTTGGNLINQGYGTGGNLLNQGYTTGGNLINQGITGGTNALSNAYQIGGGLTGQGYSDLNAMLANASGQGLNYLNTGLTGLGAAAGAAQAGYGTANTGLTGAGNMLNLGANVLGTNLGQAGSFGTYPESQYTAAYNAPWLPLSNEASILGGALGGQGTTTTSQPYYSNTGANILGGLAGGLGLANTIGGANGLFPGAISSGLSALGIGGGAAGGGLLSFADALPFII